ncbi:MAG: uracil phosphoribosyltransferase [Candidatus Riflebacteria bacterium]|nr:uracil phosphoribosyltransferase [Candidatus Riflebacteria bacterium]
MSNLHLIDHPLVKHKLTLLRSKFTDVHTFRELMQELSLFLAYEATRTMPCEETICETPMTKTSGYLISSKLIAIIPILRAGLGMVEGLLKFMPMAKVGHIGLFRDHETLKPVQYYCKLPEGIANLEVFVIDPMLATGGSVAKAIDIIKQQGAKKIRFLSIISCPEGIKTLSEAHPDVEIYTCVVDDHLNKDGYILPGLGDAGDRLYGTK